MSDSVSVTTAADVPTTAIVDNAATRPVVSSAAPTVTTPSTSTMSTTSGAVISVPTASGATTSSDDRSLAHFRHARTSMSASTATSPSTSAAINDTEASASYSSGSPTQPPKTGVTSGRDVPKPTIPQELRDLVERHTVYAQLSVPVKRLKVGRTKDLSRPLIPSKIQREFVNISGQRPAQTSLHDPTVHVWGKVNNTLHAMADGTADITTVTECQQAIVDGGMFESEAELQAAKKDIEVARRKVLDITEDRLKRAVYTLYLESANHGFSGVQLVCEENVVAGKTDATLNWLPDSLLSVRVLFDLPDKERRKYAGLVNIEHTRGTAYTLSNAIQTFRQPCFWHLPEQATPADKPYTELIVPFSVTNPDVYWEDVKHFFNEMHNGREVFDKNAAFQTLKRLALHPVEMAPDIEEFALHVDNLDFDDMPASEGTTIQARHTFHGLKLVAQVFKVKAAKGKTADTWRAQHLQFKKLNKTKSLVQSGIAMVGLTLSKEERESRKVQNAQAKEKKQKEKEEKELAKEVSNLKPKDDTLEESDTVMTRCMRRTKAFAVQNAERWNELKALMKKQGDPIQFIVQPKAPTEKYPYKLVYPEDSMNGRFERVMVLTMIGPDIRTIILRDIGQSQTFNLLAPYDNDADWNEAIEQLATDEHATRHVQRVYDHDATDYDKVTEYVLASPVDTQLDLPYGQECLYQLRHIRHVEPLQPPSGPFTYQLEYLDDHLSKAGETVRLTVFNHLFPQHPIKVFSPDFLRYYIECNKDDGYFKKRIRALGPSAVLTDHDCVTLWLAMHPVRALRVRYAYCRAWHAYDLARDAEMKVPRGTKRLVPRYVERDLDAGTKPVWHRPTSSEGSWSRLQPTKSVDRTMLDRHFEGFEKQHRRKDGDDDSSDEERESEEGRGGTPVLDDEDESPKKKDKSKKAAPAVPADDADILPMAPPPGELSASLSLELERYRLTKHMMVRGGDWGAKMWIGKRGTSDQVTLFHAIACDPARKRKALCQVGTELFLLGQPMYTALQNGTTEFSWVTHEDEPHPIYHRVGGTPMERFAFNSALPLSDEANAGNLTSGHSSKFTHNRTWPSGVPSGDLKMAILRLMVIIHNTPRCEDCPRLTIAEVRTIHNTTREEVNEEMLKALYGDEYVIWKCHPQSPSSRSN